MRTTNFGAQCLAQNALLASRKTLQIRWLSQRLRIPSPATNCRYEVGIRILRFIRESRINFRKLVKSRLVAGSVISDTGRARLHRPQPMLAAMAREPATYFESALVETLAADRFSAARAVRSWVYSADSRSHGGIQRGALGCSRPQVDASAAGF